MSNQQKSNFARAALFFCSFLYRCFARLQRETSRNFLVTRFMEEMSYVFLFTFFPLSLIFTQVAASISYFLTATTKFHVVALTKNVPFVFFFLTVALFLVELRWPGVAIRFPAKITRHLAPAYMKWVYSRRSCATSQLNFLGWIVFLPMVLRWLASARESSAISDGYLFSINGCRAITMQMF